MVEADQRDQLEDLLDAERCREPFPELVGDRRRVVQLVDQPDQQPFFLAPGRIVRAAAQGGPDLRRRQGDPLGEERDVDAPLVGTAAARARNSSA